MHRQCFHERACFSKFEKQTKGSSEVNQMNQLLASEKFLLLCCRSGWHDNLKAC